MKKRIAIAILVALGGGTMTASAESIAIAGSDTLEPLVVSLLNLGAVCGGGAGNLTYSGVGSGAGETAITNQVATVGGQKVAPMSRALKTAPPPAGICDATHGQSTAEGIAVGLDTVSIIANTAVAANCRPLAGSTPDLGATWDAKLRLLYFGVESLGGSPVCGGTNRRNLAAGYANIFDSGCSAGGGTVCNGALEHAFRRSDLSGTSDFLKSTLFPGLTAPQYCNGTDKQDMDPVRRTCADGDQVCSADGTLGLVLPIFVPGGGADLTVLYRPKPCLSGTFVSTQPLSIAPPGTGGVTDSACCVRESYDNGLNDGLASPAPVADPNVPGGIGRQCLVAPVLGKCSWAAAVAATKEACLNGLNATCLTQNKPAAGWTKVKDARVMNAVLRTGTGTILLDSGTGTQVTNAYHRIFTNNAGKFVTGTPNSGLCGTNVDLTGGCQKLDATEGIGCLVASTKHRCSFGFSGRDGVVKQPAGVVETLALRGAEANQANAQANVANPATGYPITRKLFMNSLVGFETVNDPSTPNQFALAKCFAGPQGQAQLTPNGFFPLASGGAECVEACGGATHCNNNPAGIPQ